MLVIMKGLLSGYNIYPSTIYEACNTKELRLFENAASSGPFFLYNIVQYAFLLIDHGGHQPRPRQVRAQYGQPVAQKIAIGLL